MKRWFGSLVAGAALLQAGAAAAEAPKNCAETFQTPAFQALDLLEPHEVPYLLELLGPLKGQTCTIDQLEAFFNAKHALTFNKDKKNIVFQATLKTSTLLWKKIVWVGARIEKGTITEVTAGMEGF